MSVNLFKRSCVGSLVLTPVVTSFSRLLLVDLDL